MKSGPDPSIVEALPNFALFSYREKRAYLIEHFPTWFHERAFNCAGFFEWAKKQPSAWIRNACLRALDPAEMREVLKYLGIWGQLYTLQQTVPPEAMHGYLENMLPFWRADGTFDTVSFDHWYQRAIFMDAEIVYQHLSLSEKKSVLHLWSKQINHQHAQASVSIELEDEKETHQRANTPKFLLF